MRNDPMLDKNFLKALDEWNEREVYVKLVSLDFNENPRAEIQGYATGGSIQVNGASAVRRTCNLTLVTNEININEFDWALKTKFKVYIGLKNYIDTKNYDDIIWFKQGVYVLTSFSQTYNTSGYTISIQGKDKMCLLDGSIGGSLPFAHDFGKIEVTYENEVTKLEDVPIYTIIRDAIHTYAQEPYENIIISDLEDCSVELLDYRAKKADLIVYDMFDEGSNGTYTSNIVFQGSDLFDKLKAKYTADGCLVQDGSQWYRIVKYVTYGDTVGYRLTDLIYVGDLIFGAGSAITKMLDAIVKQLGEFEYFYDIDGKFIFRRKKIFFNIAWNNGITVNKETYYDNVKNPSASEYTFTNSILIDSFNNKPQIDNIRNDFAVWGKLQSVSGSVRPINLRYAIDDKPTKYKSLLENKTYGVIQFIPDKKGAYYFENGRYEKIESESELPKDSARYRKEVTPNCDFYCDWRELIYLMAKDQSKSSTKIEELTTQIANETDPEILSNLKEQLTAWENTWNTGYDAYYPEFLDEDRWRNLYCGVSNEAPYKIVNGVKKYLIPEEEYPLWIQNKGWNPKYFYSNEHGSVEIIDPDNLPFWFDFLDSESYLSKYKVSVIGRRTKAVKDEEIKAIFYRTTPPVLFINPLDTEPMTDTDLSYVRMNLVGGMANYFRISTQGKSAGEEMNNLVYNHTYYCESITLNTIPVYYLEPNTRITVHDEKTGINGEYIIKQFTIQLSHDGTMSITATKIDKSII